MDKSVDPTQAQADLLRIRIGDAFLLLRSAQIREVVRPQLLTSVPMGPDHLLGMSHVRGQVVCVIDAGLVSGLAALSGSHQGQMRWLLLQHERMHVAICVDEVLSIHKAVLTQRQDRVLETVVLNGREMPLLDCRHIFQAIQS